MPAAKSKTVVVQPEPATGESTALYNRYRPIVFEHFVGQDALVNAAKISAAGGTDHTYMLAGPRGTGKTSMARVIASALGIAPTDIVEIKAAVASGVDNIRDLLDSLQYRPFGGGGRAVIIDEGHRLSAAAWDGLLKDLEEPPAWLYWFVCTTEPKKLPATIRSRGIILNFQPIAIPVLEQLLDEICVAENLDPVAGIIGLCAREADGSARQAISYLSTCHSAATLEDAGTLLESAEVAGEAVELARMLVKGTSWAEVRALLGRMKGQSPESIRRVVNAYVAAVALGASNPVKLLAVLNAFSQPFDNATDLSPVILALGTIFYAE